MTQLWRSNPWPGDPLSSFEQLRRSLDEIFEGGGARAPRRAAAFPPVNLYESAEGYVLTAELPGLRAEDIEVSLEGNRVTLGGERVIERPDDASLHRAERRAGRFRRTVELPGEVDADKVEAAHRHGVLILRIPKAERNQPRRISVQSH